MCGLIAQYLPRGLVTQSALRNALRSLKHRGPDGNGVWIAKDGHVGLGHARLAIIGLDNGSQPIANEDQSVFAVVNGEFYDFERIRTDLQMRGHQFRTQSDSEILLHLYEEYGLDCLKELRGEFAFVLWDANKSRLFAARDRFGIKPLVYAINESGLTLASEAKALFASGVVARWDDESFFDACNLQYVLPDRTLFAGVMQLQPGHMLVADANGATHISCYWDLQYPRGDRQLNQREQSEAIETFSEKFEESVRLRLRADIPVCCHLSGGLDSSSIVAVAAKYSRSPVDCFSVTFSEESYDELQVANRMAKHAGAVLHPVLVSQSDLIEQLPNAVYFSEGFAVNGHLTAKYLLHKEISAQGFKVALAGEGSDEIVAGYAHLRNDLFASQGRHDLIAAVGKTNTVSKGIMLQHGRSLSLHAVEERLKYIPNFLQAKGTLGHKLSSTLTPDYAGRYAGVDCYERLMDSFDVQGQLEGRSRVNQSLYLWTKTALANYILRTLGDGTEMANSVEGRIPFLDHHLFEYVRTLPLSMKINQMTEKFVLREAVKPIVTEEIYRRQKHPFVAPPLSTFADQTSLQILQDELRSREFASIPFFDQKAIVNLLDRLPSMSDEDRSANDPVFMTALSALALHKSFSL